MAGMGAYIGGILTGAWSLVTGMAVTFRYMFKPVKTVQYPREKLALPLAFRGHIELVVDPVARDHRCVACGECFRTCPTKVIKVQGEKEQASDNNRARLFFIDYSHCSLCGLCVEVCPQGAIKFSQVYEEVGSSRYSAVVDLLVRLKTEGGRT